MPPPGSLLGGPRPTLPGLTLARLNNTDLQGWRGCRETQGHAYCQAGSYGPERREAWDPGRRPEAGPVLESEFCITIESENICSFRASALLPLGSILVSH